MPADEFTYGGALNLGCAAARGEILVALSAHAFPPDDRWLERMLEPFGDERVACASGDDFDPDGGRLERRMIQDLALARRNPNWGYSNSAGAFRSDLWRDRPFRSDMPFSEDKEWAWHWLKRERLVVVGPDLSTNHDHSKDPLPTLYRRSNLKWVGYSMFLDLEPYGVRSLAREWWCEQESYRSRARARLSHRRAARLLGSYTGRRRARRVTARDR
jgi:hypothetical protein